MQVFAHFFDGRNRFRDYAHAFIRVYTASLIERGLQKFYKKMIYAN